MNKRRRYRAVLVLGTVCLLMVGAGGLWLRSVRRQEALNRQLIAALVKDDPKQALALVNAGADPNTPLEPMSPPSLTQLWNHLIHRTEPARNASPSAFFMACGAYTSSADFRFLGIHTDEPELVETMLQHGARKNAKQYNGMTPLLWSISVRRPKTAGALIEHGVDVNAQVGGGFTALSWAVFESRTDNPSERSKDTNIVRQLLAHGANPNVPGPNGLTPLQMAHNSNRPDLVALLKQAGAKK